MKENVIWGVVEFPILDQKEGQPWAVNRARTEYQLPCNSTWNHLGSLNITLWNATFIPQDVGLVEWCVCMKTFFCILHETFLLIHSLQTLRFEYSLIFCVCDCINIKRDDFSTLIMPYDYSPAAYCCIFILVMASYLTMTRTIPLLSFLLLSAVWKSAP